MSGNSAPKSDEYGISLRLSAQRALLDNIPASLRCASLEYRGTEIVACFVFDGEPTDDDRELLSCASSEIISDYPAPYTMSEEYLAIPYPAKIPFLRHIVFKRHEGEVAA